MFILCIYFQLRKVKWCRSSRPDVICKKNVLRNFAKFTEKHMYQSLFFLTEHLLWLLLPLAICNIGKYFTRFSYFPLREKCPNTEFFLVSIFLYSIRIQENTDQKKLRIWTFFTQCCFYFTRLKASEISLQGFRNSWNICHNE